VSGPVRLPPGPGFLAGVHTHTRMPSDASPIFIGFTISLGTLWRYSATTCGLVDLPVYAAFGPEEPWQSAVAPPIGHGQPLRPELQAVLGSLAAVTADTGVGGRRCWRLSGAVAVLLCCTCVVGG